MTLLDDERRVTITADDAFGLDLKAEAARFMESAAALLVAPDPGPTPFLVDQLIVDCAIAAIQGQHKRGKTWLLLELAIAIVTGGRAFDRYDVPEPGPVMLILEESGRDALHRRLGALQRGQHLKPADLLELHFATNKRVRLDDPDWQQRMLDAADYLKPRAIFLDPLVRLKGANVDENVQKEMAPVLDFMRDLRDASSAAVVFVQHTGHDGSRLRGTSDLEAYWESKVTVEREPGGLSTLTAQQREAEATPELRYRLAWHDASRSMRLAPVDTPDAATELRGDLLALIEREPGQSTEQLAKAVHKRKEHARSHLENLERVGTVQRAESQARDRLGRTITRSGWYPAPQAREWTVPTDRTEQDRGPGAGVCGPRSRPL